MADDEDKPVHEKAEEAGREFFDKNSRELYKGDDTELKDDIGRLYEPASTGNDDEDEDEKS